MILWTIQHRDAYKKMMDTGTLQADGQHSPCLDDFRESYRWMAEQMIKRIGNPPRGIVYPVWAWYQWEGKRKRPDMRTHGRGCGEKGTPITLLTIDVPEKHILLSDFDYWHFVLNDIPLRFSKDGKIENCSETEKLKSWEKIFDTAYRIEGDEDTPISTQAVLWEIKKEWLIKAENFITR